MESQKSPKYDWGAIQIKHPYEENREIEEAAIEFWSASNPGSPIPPEFVDGFRVGVVYAQKKSLGQHRC